MFTVLRVVKELVKHLDIMCVLSCNYMIWIFVVSFDSFLPDWIFVVLSNFIKYFLTYYQTKLANLLPPQEQIPCTSQLIFVFLMHTAVYLKF